MNNFFTGEFKGLSTPETVQLVYGWDIIQLKPSQGKEH